MNKFLYALSFLLFGAVAYGQSELQPQRTVADASTASVGKELARNEFYSFSTKDEFVNGDIRSINYLRFADGTWKYKITDSAPSAQYLSLDYDDSSWSSITVPMDKPLVTENKIKKIAEPFAVELPADAPVVVFRRRFGIPLDWYEREIFLHTDALSSGSVIYINGEAVAYNDDAHASAEFNITKYCVEGANQLAIVSYTHNAGSFLEQGDNFSAGMIGGAYITSRHKVMLRDYIVKTTFDPSYTNGLLEFGAIIKTHYLNSSEVKVFFDLYDENDDVIDAQSKYARLNMKVEDTVYFSVPVRDVKKWSSEKPYLYKAVLRVQNQTRFTEYASMNIGFREVEIVDNDILINGVKTAIRGARLSSNDIPSDSEALEQMLRGLKSGGINALWVSTLQNKAFYDTTDKLGFYLFNSANVSSPSASKDLRYSLANNRVLLSKFIERTTNLYESVKSRPSVVVLALGEGAGNGYNSYQSYISIKDRDASRPVVYDDAGREWNSDIHILDGSKTSLITKYTPTTHPAIALDVKASALERVWKSAKESGNVQGVFVSSAQEVDVKKGRELFSDFDISVNEFAVTIKNNTQYSTLDDYTVECTLYSKKDKAKRVLTPSFSAAIGESQTVVLELPTLMIPRFVSSIAVAIKDKNGVEVENKSFKIR